jgi:hypothetical protein
MLTSRNFYFIGRSTDLSLFLVFSIAEKPEGSRQQQTAEQGNWTSYFVYCPQVLFFTCKSGFVMHIVSCVMFCLNLKRKIVHLHFVMPIVSCEP